MWRPVVVALIALTLSYLGVSAKQAEAGYAAIVVDQATGEVLYERNADDQNYPASLTKMMTLYMVFSAMESGRLQLDTRLRVSANATKQPPSKLGFEAGETITVENAIRALVTKSANDVAVVVAEALAGSEKRFAEAMTKRAHKLDMKNTTFQNASGLPDRKQISSARDMARLAIALKRDFPVYYGYFATESFAFDGAVHKNHNKLLGRYDGVDGVKTGYTRSSGYNLVASAERNGRRLVAVVLGGDSARQRDMQVMRLLDSGFGLAAPPPDLKVADRSSPGGKVARASKKSAKAARGDGAGGRYTIQVGAYGSKAEAHKAIKRVSRKFSSLVAGTAPDVSPIKAKRGKKLYRAAFAGLSKTNAVKACKQLDRAKIPCLVLSAPKSTFTVASLAP
jgi:D-alanyl-D-alanine carboxypeptidase